MNTKITHKISSDWYDSLLNPPVHFSLIYSNQIALFEAHRAAPAQIKPKSQAGVFQSELWQNDVAELFLHSGPGTPYLEVNLAPNGAWWMCWFDSIRHPRAEQPQFKGVKASGILDKDNWRARIEIPAALLPPIEQLHINATFILNSPQQSFHSWAPLSGKEPDFHQPDQFRPFLSHCS